MMQVLSSTAAERSMAVTWSKGERGVAASSGRELNRSPPGGRERAQRPLTCTLVFRELRHTMRWRLWDRRRPSGEGEEQK